MGRGEGTERTSAPRRRRRGGYRAHLEQLYAEHDVKLVPFLRFDGAFEPAFGQANYQERHVTLGPFPARADDEDPNAHGFNRADVYWLGLHELAHVVLGHAGGGGIFGGYSEQYLRNEVEAWRWALAASRYPLGQRGRQTIADSLRSYGLEEAARELLGELPPPMDRWTEERVRAELEQLSAELGRLPSAEELRAAGRSDLLYQVRVRGGLSRWSWLLRQPLKHNHPAGWQPPRRARR